MSRFVDVRKAPGVRSVFFRRCTLFLCLFLTAVGLSGCEAYYVLYIENDTDQYVDIMAHGQEIKAPPCSVWGHSITGPPYGWPFTVTAKDPDNTRKVMQRWVFRAGRKHKGGPYYIQIQPKGAAVCPRSPEGLQLRVVNKTSDVLQVSWDGAPVGTVPAGSEAVLGPFPATWRDLGRAAISRHGVELTADLLVFDLRYKLGDMPEVGILVR